LLHGAFATLLEEKKADDRADGSCVAVTQYYPGNLNVSSCCKKDICSECYLQMRTPQKPIKCVSAQTFV